jgi:hypothetical protein
MRLPFLQELVESLFPALAEDYQQKQSLLGGTLGSVDQVAVSLNE